MPAIPYVSVVLPTRDRPDQLTTAVTAILANTFNDFEVVVVDQSSDDLTAARVQHLMTVHERLHYVRDSGTGSSHARNVGIAVSLGEILAFTDDDCEAAPDWLSEIAAAFNADSSLGVACGAVLPGSHDAHMGFIVGYQPRRRERLSGRMAKVRDGGIGANMSFRRRAVNEVGGWDELLGAGSQFEGAGDRDLVYRVLGAGYALLHLPEAMVVHRGFRNWRAGGQLMRGRFRGIGAAYGKHLRLGDPIAGVLLLQELWLASANIVRCLVSARRPVGLGRLYALLGGLFASFGPDLDPSTKRYVVLEQKPDTLPRKRIPRSQSAVPDRPAG